MAIGSAPGSDRHSGLAGVVHISANAGITNPNASAGWRDTTVAMSDEKREEALISALTTEHFVLQNAASSTIFEAGARSSMYMLSLSSSLIAIGFTAQSDEVFIPFVAAVLPVVFVLGVFTVVRLVDTVLENQQYMANIAQIRSYYRALTPEAETYFAPRHGRWPEPSDVPALRLGLLPAFLGTSASMIAFINSVVAGAFVALLVNEALGDIHIEIALGCAALMVALLMVLFLAYQRWRFAGVELAVKPEVAERDE